MATVNVLFDGVSGYMGGTVLYKFKNEQSTRYQSVKLFALVRDANKAEKAEHYGATPLIGSLDDEEAIYQMITSNNITTILHMADTTNWVRQSYLIKALAAVKSDVQKHYVSVAGADSFGPATGWPRKDAVSDLEDCYQQEVDCAVSYERRTVDMNIHNTAEAAGIKSYIVFAPCVYGLGSGFGHVTSIQVPGLIRAAAKDRAAHYTLPGTDAGGYYFAESGFASWQQMTQTVAKFMYKRGLVDSAEATPWPGLPDKSIAAQSLNCTPGYVSHIFGGLVRLNAQRGATIGWKPKYDESYFFEQFDNEIDPLQEKNFAFEAKKILKHDEIHGEGKH
ncbi:hypothetical protein CI109_106303 [Kwoniella shandongensis]|uniref:NAD-dependent epimerase/dehydratase domain-containing protein n=1 Tax=Kwoniella shandongensis TaxID=1734106 RepID=A0AAJ8MY70_9TREE